MQIDGIKRESTDGGHKEWIEVSRVSFGVMQPRSATASTGGGHTAERAELTDINFFKVADLASPLLFQTCAQGKTIPKAKFEFMRADGSGTPIKYYEIELENVLIGRLAMDAVDGELLGESIGLKYSKIKVKYTEQKIAGGAGGNTTGSWNLANNRTTTRLAPAIAEFGRIDKTLHTLTYIDYEAKRRGTLTQLNRGEGRHSIASPYSTASEASCRSATARGRKTVWKGRGKSLNLNGFSRANDGQSDLCITRCP